MILRSRTIRLGIFLSTLIIAAIVVFQLIWLRKVYNYEQKEFDHSIARAVRNLYDDLNIDLDSDAHLSDLIKRYNNQTYFIKMDRLHSSDSLTFYLHDELENEDIFTDCLMGVYDAGKKQYVYSAYLPAATSAKNHKAYLPASQEDYHHITLYFPYRNQYILSLMNFWLISSAVLLVVLVLLGGSLYYFYRQKFLNETQKAFINNFTHEFKTPVAVIHLAAETLENPDIVKKPEKLAKYASIVKYQCNYLQDQIGRLLHYAYAESNQLNLKKENVSLHQVITEAVDNLQPLIEEKSALIEYQLEADEDAVITDHGYLLIVVTNLIENALKYAAHPKVIINTWLEDGCLALSVKDNGKGIEAKDLKKIFQQFYRANHGEQTWGKGFGLGLTFVKRIVKAHRGKISVESIPGIGSNFVVKLPLP